jgi:hypothetical protein
MDRDRLDDSAALALREERKRVFITSYGEQEILINVTFPHRSLLCPLWSPFDSRFPLFVQFGKDRFGASPIFFGYCTFTRPF